MARVSVVGVVLGAMRRRHVLGLLVGTAAISTVSPSAFACLWDSDTLEQEAAGAPKVVPTLVGGFPRNPDRYYAMRLERVSAQLETTKDDLALYDDAAVAADRLGKHGEAIAWMTEKKAAMDRLGVEPGSKAGEPSHWYRYYANLGTFHAHRWLHAGAKWDATEDLDEGHALIAKAIADNPNAHFGREKYQLKALAWLRGKPSMTNANDGLMPTFVPVDFGAMHQTGDNDHLAKQGMADATAGLCGLIALGAAWNSVDVTVALAYVLAMDGKGTLVQMARRRVKELVDAGGKSLVPDAPTGGALLDRVPGGMLEDPSEIDRRFDALRAKAKAWASRRERYMLARLDAGEHPDTHPAFWEGFSEDPHHMGDKGSTPPPVPSKKGCACGVVGGSGGEDALSASLALGAVTVLRRLATP